MSRLYRMDLGLQGYNPLKLSDIQSAIDDEWDFSELFVTGDHAECSGESNLCGGESEEEFSERLAKAIFKANGRPCKINLLAVYLEDLPCEEYTFGEKDFDRLDPLAEKKED